ncbi:ribonuclease E inhibitor RraB [Sphingomonas sp. 22176]|uniref:ribonuclease E inhibitor RraB n=1 Tax=Sphingomonas sp. 22176 TaxID=3453884 RepID=UPI003F86375C
MNLPPFDPARFEEEWAADRDVFENLAANGDNAAVARPIDVSFKGSADALAALEDAAEELGFTVLGDETSKGGARWLFLERSQPTDETSIRALTELCLRIEAHFGLEYDGWGCVAETGMKH